MTPAASVSGLYFASPHAKYFSVGRIGRDQVDDVRRPQGHGRRRGRALARAQPRLRAAVGTVCPYFAWYSTLPPTIV